MRPRPRRSVRRVGVPRIRALTRLHSAGLRVPVEHFVYRDRFARSRTQGERTLHPRELVGGLGKRRPRQPDHRTHLPDEFAVRSGRRRRRRARLHDAAVQRSNLVDLGRRPEQRDHRPRVLTECVLPDRRRQRKHHCRHGHGTARGRASPPRPVVLPRRNRRAQSARRAPGAARPPTSTHTKVRPDANPARCRSWLGRCNQAAGLTLKGKLTGVVELKHGRKHPQDRIELPGKGGSAQGNLAFVFTISLPKNALTALKARTRSR